MRVLPLLATTLLIAAGCSGGQQEGPVCPDSAIIYGLDRFSGTDAQGNELAVTLENIDGVCQMQGDTLNLEMTFDIVVTGPEGTVIPYFVALADPGGNLLDKTAFSVTVPAGAEQDFIRLRENIAQEVRAVAEGTSPAYSIMIGLDLPPETALQQRREL